MKKEAAKIASVKFLVSVLLITLFVGLVSAGDVAYIYKNKVSVDQNVVKAFEELGLTVDLIDEKSFSGKNLPPDFLDYRVLFVGDERFKNSKNFPIYTVPTIISNYYFGESFGLTDRDGISQLGSSSALSVKKDNRVIQVYTQAMSSGISIPYYYLAKENKAQGVQSIALTYTGDNFDLGDVIGYIPAQTQLLNNKKAQKNMCFFGIIENKYWTSEAKQMFKDCAQFVGVVCRNNADCPATTNSTPYCINTNIYRDVNSFSCQNAGSIQSSCVANNNSVLVKSCPGSCTNGVCVCQDKDHDGYDECSIGDDQDDGKEKDCNDNDAQVHPNAAEVCDGKDNDCDGTIDENNGLCEQGKLCSLGQCVSIACFNNSDCGTDGFIENTFCQNDDVYQKYKVFTCTNTGTVTSSCSFAIENRTVEDCGVGKVCSGGMCIKQCLDKDNDTYDDCDAGEAGDDGKAVDCNDNDASVNP
ncbi:MAG: putative metal-binding motif-containing protein, partial [Nanoarchaeota archaeon]